MNRDSVITVLNFTGNLYNKEYLRRRRGKALREFLERGEVCGEPLAIARDGFAEVGWGVEVAAATSASARRFVLYKIARIHVETLEQDLNLRHVLERALDWHDWTGVRALDLHDSTVWVNSIW